MASYDTWIKQYRPDENTPNTAVDYYPKGAVIAFLLDARIRRATGGAKTLDDGMRRRCSDTRGAKGYTPEQFYAVMSEVAGADLEGVVREGGGIHRGARLHATRSITTACASARSDPRNARAVPRRRRRERQRTAGRQQRASRHPALRRRAQRGRRDPRDRRRPGPRRRAGARGSSSIQARATRVHVLVARRDG